MLPTSPAKHFALPLGRKLKMQNTRTPMIAITKKEESIKAISFFNRASGESTAKAYPAVIPLISSIKLITFVAPTQIMEARITIHQIFQCIIPMPQNIKAMVVNWTTRQILSGSDFTLSQKLTRATISKPIRKGSPNKSSRVGNIGVIEMGHR